MTIQFDCNQWPLVLLRQVGKTSEEGLTQYLTDLEKLHLRTSDFAIVLDLREGEPFTFSQRARQNQWIANHPEHLKRLRGMAFVENSFAMRTAMKAALFARPPTYRYSVTADLEEGMRWARSLFEASPALPVSSGTG